MGKVKVIARSGGTQKSREKATESGQTSGAVDDNRQSRETSFPRSAKKTDGPPVQLRGPSVTVKETACSLAGAPAGTSRRSSSSRRPHSKSAGSNAHGAGGSTCGDGGTFACSSWAPGRSSWAQRHTREQQRRSGQQQRRSEQRLRSWGQRRSSGRHSWERRSSACSNGCGDGSTCGDGNAACSSWAPGRSSWAQRHTRVQQRSWEPHTTVGNSHGGRMLSHPTRWQTQTGRRRAEPAAQCGISWTVTPQTEKLGIFLFELRCSRLPLAIRIRVVIRQAYSAILDALRREASLLVIVDPTGAS